MFWRGLTWVNLISKQLVLSTVLVILTGPRGSQEQQEESFVPVAFQQLRRALIDGYMESRHARFCSRFALGEFHFVCDDKCSSTGSVLPLCHPGAKLIEKLAFGDRTLVKPCQTMTLAILHLSKTEGVPWP